MRMDSNASVARDDARPVLGVHDVAAVPVWGDKIATTSLALRFPDAGECELVLCHDGGHTIYRLNERQLWLIVQDGVKALANWPRENLDNPTLTAANHSGTIG